MTITHTADKPLEIVIRPLRRGGFVYEIFLNGCSGGYDIAPSEEKMGHVVDGFSRVATFRMGGPLPPEVEAAYLAQFDGQSARYGGN